MDNTVYLCYHVERTGGTTVRHMLFNHYGWYTGAVYPHYSTFQGKPGLNPFVLNEETSKSMVIIGHEVHYGIHEIIGKPYHYIVFLRDPISRMWSLFNHTRVADIEQGRPPIEFDPWFELYKERSQIWSLCQPNAASLEVAKELVRKTSFIGLTETFHADVCQLFYPYDYMENHNSTRERIEKVGTKAPEITSKEATILRGVLDDDYELYDFVKQLRDGGHNAGFRFPPAHD